MAAHTSTVLVADDSRATARALAELLANAGLRVELASDGAEALRRALEPEMDLVLLDLALPELDGLQVLRLLRARPERRHLPVIVLTVTQDPHARLTALQLGADDVLTKPWDTEVLLARVRRCLELKTALDLRPTAPPEDPSRDPVTALLSRTGLQDRLQDEFRRSQRYADPLALVQVELDGFPTWAERRGKPAADAMLVEVAHALRRAVRETDQLGRHEGGRFAALLPRTSIAGGLTAAERMLGQLRTARREKGLACTVSLGVAGYPHRAISTADHLWTSAGEALAQSRQEGGDRIRLFSQALARSEEDAQLPGGPGRF